MTILTFTSPCRPHFSVPLGMLVKCLVWFGRLNIVNKDFVGGQKELKILDL